MAATLINHPDAESVFFARLDSLLDSLFPGGAFLQGNPGIRKTHRGYPQQIASISDGKRRNEIETKEIAWIRQ